MDQNFTLSHFNAKAKSLLEATFFIIFFKYVAEVEMQVQNGLGVHGSLVPYILDMGLAWWDSVVILDLYIYFRWVKLMIKNVIWLCEKRNISSNVCSVYVETIWLRLWHGSVVTFWLVNGYHARYVNRWTQLYMITLIIQMLF